MQQDMDIQTINNETKMNIKSIKKPLNSYQLYCKAMREKWENLPESERCEYEKQALSEKLLYDLEIKKIKEIAEEKIKKKKIFLSFVTGDVPCVGLDNGFTSYHILGPVSSIELFTDKEKQKLISKGVPETSIGKYKSVGGFNFNWRAAKKYEVSVYGGCQNDRRSWGYLLENYDGEAGNITHYHNYKEEKWTTKY